MHWEDREPYMPRGAATKPNLVINDDLMPAFNLMFILGREYAAIGPLNAYPAIQTIQSANLKFLLATGVLGVAEDFSYALHLELAEMLGWTPLPRAQSANAAGVAVDIDACTNAASQIPANRRVNFAGRQETSVWTFTSMLGSLFA